MDEKTFKKRFKKMEKFLYENIFLKNTSISDTLKLSLNKHTKFIIFANLRFTLVYNCLLRAKEEKIYHCNLNPILKDIEKICFYLDKIIDIETNIITDIKK